MKKNITLFSSMILSLMILASCGSSNSESSSSETTASPEVEAPASAAEPAATTEEPAETKEETTAAAPSEEKESGNDCDAFLKEYEEWVNEYVTVAKKMKSNPSDMSILSDYTRMMSELNDWESKGKDCAGSASAAAKMLKIQSKLAGAMN
jgi:hypothetical protein